MVDKQDASIVTLLALKCQGCIKPLASINIPQTTEMLPTLKVTPASHKYVIQYILMVMFFNCFYIFH